MNKNIMLLENNLKKIREMTENIGFSYNETLDFFSFKEILNLPLGKGKTRGIYKSDKSTIFLTIFDSNTKSFEHMYPNKEVLIILKGLLTVNMKEKAEEFKAGDIVTIMPNISHFFHTKTGCEFFTIIFPVSKNLINIKRG